jgi:two-component system, chemotaxis family, protein-glutamate methylesterase/glutaminase
MSTTDSQRRIVVIGGSAGSLEPLLHFFSRITSDINASYFVVQHIASDATQFLAELITRNGVLPAQVAGDNVAFERGRVYVAPPDYHLMLRDGTTQLSHGPRENRTRPAIDPLFRSAAVEHGSKVIGILLSGMLDDGTAGLVAIKRCGGTAIVQDPAEAAFADMPRSALASLVVDHCLSIQQVPEMVATLAQGPTPPELDVPQDLQLEVDITRRISGTAERADSLGERSSQSCPECGGPLWELHDHHITRYRCTVGHSFTGRALLADQDESVERALWAAIRTLEERRRLLEQLVAESIGKGSDRMSESYQARRDETVEHIDQLRRLLLARP